MDRFADTAACLYRLTGAKVKFDWGEEEEDSFQKLKEAITEAPLLVYPREGGGFVLDTDASDKAIGAVLSQVQDGKERVVAYGSFVLEHGSEELLCDQERIVGNCGVYETF